MGGDCMKFRTGIPLFIFSVCCAAAPAPAQVSPPGADVRIIVRSFPGDALVENAYVALVAPYQPWSRPLVEKVTRDGIALLRVPVGSYRVVAAASGRSVAIKGPILISGEQKNDISLQLSALNSVTGTVSDDQGHPLQGATIADVNAMVEAPLGRLSELGKHQFGASWKTSSQKEGSWFLTLP